jgi:alpha-D-xyloside xylohydrolase
MWSGDVGNDWETFRRQLTAGLGMQAAGIPWWTYDAGGFFRPGDQYTNADYIERMLRWIETSVYLPLMRVHGYMSNTEPWNYGEEAKTIITQCLNERYRLQPYIYSHAADVSFLGSTLMRPLVFDFPEDDVALEQNYEYMFGKSLLVSPVVEAKATQWSTYLPRHAAGWYDYRSGKHYSGGKSAISKVTLDGIPVFVRGGSILPLAVDPLTASQTLHTPLEIRIYPGADATFTLYEDDGWSNDYEQGACSRITFRWDDGSRQLTIADRFGQFAGMPQSRRFEIQVVSGDWQSVIYEGKSMKIDFNH